MTKNGFWIWIAAASIFALGALTSINRGQIFDAVLATIAAVLFTIVAFRRKKSTDA